jgi:uncharacterized protein YggU (UPF0235/DUF167 family)
MLEVRVQPGARRAALKGWLESGALRVAVTAPAEAGRANDAVAELLAGALRVRPRSLTLRRGATSRSKLFEIEGMTAADLRARLERAMAADEGSARGH